MNGPYVVAIIPAHNEARNIAKTLKSIKNQVDYVIVACDHCQDNTEQVAYHNGADKVFETIHNHARKAGALNQTLENYVNWSLPNLYVMVIDADTQIVSNWMAKAKTLVRLSGVHQSGYRQNHHKYDAVGSIFYSNRTRHPTMLELCQHNEWVRYANKIKRDHRVFVLTGTCSLISARKLLAVHRKYHRFYDENSLTEDFAMTIDLKEVGAKLISPLSCVCTTKTMRHYSDLVRQRRRWYLGAIKLIMRRKLDHVTWPYVLQQIMLLISVFAFTTFLLMSALVYLTGGLHLTLFWSIAFVIFCTERVLSIWNEPVLDRFFAASMIPELIYSFVLQWAYLLAILAYFNHLEIYWNQNQDGS